MTRNHNRYDLWTLSADWATTPVASTYFRNATVTVIAASSADLTLKCYTSNWETAPDLSAAASATNEYAPTQMTNLDTWANIDGSTWIVLAWSSDWVTRYEINDNSNDWVWFIVSGYSAWNVTIRIDMTTNQ